jgi:hypothetical protein
MIGPSVSCAPEAIRAKLYLESFRGPVMPISEGSALNS